MSSLSCLCRVVQFAESLDSESRYKMKLKDFKQPDCSYLLRLRFTNTHLGQVASTESVLDDVYIFFQTGVFTALRSSNEGVMPYMRTALVSASMFYYLWGAFFILSNIHHVMFDHYFRRPESVRIAEYFSVGDAVSNKPS